MITKEIINDIIGIKESYELPEKLMAILEDRKRREEAFLKFLKHEKDLSYDWFTEYFQEEQGDRKQLKQDFTPDCVCKILTDLKGSSQNCADICAGTGGLTIKNWNDNKDAFYYCEEISSRALPMLLFNLSIRGITGKVVHGDSLSGEIKEIYNLKRDGNFSDIAKGGKDNQKFERAISNPPYSLPWSGVVLESDERFRGWGIPPKSKADYGFVLHSLHRTNDTGKALLILPHGVLFRGSKEGDIRRKLVERNLIDAVIGLPDKLFLNTSIPVCILILDKQKKDNNIYFIDASRDFIKEGRQNNMTDEHIQKIVDAYGSRREIDKYAHLATYEEIEESDFNLNIPRYVDSSEPEEILDIEKIVKDLWEIDREIAETEKQIFTMLGEMTGGEDFRNSVKTYSDYINQKYNGNITPGKDPFEQIKGEKQ